MKTIKHEFQTNFKVYCTSPRQNIYDIESSRCSTKSLVKKNDTSPVTLFGLYLK